MPSAFVTLDRETHTYRGTTRPLMSVTDVLQRTGYINTAWFTQEARKRGTMVHNEIAAALRTGAPPSATHEAWLGYRDAALYWLEGRVDQVCLVEASLGDEALGLAGTLDALVCLKDGRLAVVDWKTGGAAAWHRLQTSLYRYLVMQFPPDQAPWASVGLHHAARLMVYLHADTTCAEQEHSAHIRDERVALAALTVATDQMIHRLTLQGDLTHEWD